MITIRSVEVFVFRIPLLQPVRSAVGEYDNRPGVFIKIEDTDGFRGWGEVFCNFPPCGAEHRARLIDTLIAPFLLNQECFSEPKEAYQYLNQKTEIIVSKSGEYGPFAQCIAAVDIALWDMWARKQAVPLWKKLNPHGNPKIRAYASGLGPDSPEETAVIKQQEGYREFKLKVGFDLDYDISNLKALRDALGPDAQIMVDANQVWSIDEAVSRVECFEEYHLDWIEEPIRCNRPVEEWQHLAASSNIPLAAGENIRGEKAFKAMIESGSIKFIQPDIIKWGGFSGLEPVVKLSDQAGVNYCPHSLAGGIGLLASAHLLAASQNPGLLEIDANDNPLRTELIDHIPVISEGTITLPDKPGLGVEPDLEALEDYRIIY